MGFSEWTLTGTTPSGERVKVRGTDHVEFREGKIIQKDSYWKIVQQQMLLGDTDPRSLKLHRGVSWRP